MTARRRVQLIRVKFKVPSRSRGGVVKDALSGREKEQSPVKAAEEACCSSQLLMLVWVGPPVLLGLELAIVASHVPYPKQPLSHWQTAVIGPLDSRESVIQVGEHDTLKDTAEEFRQIH